LAAAEKLASASLLTFCGETVLLAADEDAAFAFGIFSALRLVLAARNFGVVASASVVATVLAVQTRVHGCRSSTRVDSHASVPACPFAGPESILRAIAVSSGCV
jgi:hypothetical protein